MAPPYSKQLTLHPASFGFAETRRHVLDNIQDVRRTVRKTRRLIEDGHEALARADAVLARRLSERR